MRDLTIRRGLTALAAGLLAVFEAMGVVPSAQAAQSRPNVVVVVTDDQRLDEMTYMPLTRQLIAGGGTTFTNAFATYPLCCPSRSTMLTGQYMHNHEVRHNSPPEGGFDAFDYSTALPVWLQRAGYRTAHIGKPLNGYGVRYDVSPGLLNPVPTPPGYDDWYSLIDPSTYEMYGYAIQDNGVTRPGSATATLYQTDAIADRAVTNIRKWAPDDKPFYMEVMPSAPHSELHNADGGPTPAPRYADTFANHPFTQSASYDEGDVSDKGSIINAFGRLSSDDGDVIADRERNRLAALQSVDEMVGRIVSAVSQAGELDNTVIMFMSDNGWFNGEHRWFSEKVDIFEESIHVPLMVRGPGFPAGRSRSQLTGNIDIAPTIAQLAGAKPMREMDGESLLPYAADPGYRRNRALGIEASFPAVSGLLAVYAKRYAGINVYYEGVRTRRYKYAEYYKSVEGKPVREEQLYDLKTDPNELRSLHADPAQAALKARLRTRLDALRRCKGEKCRASYPTPVVKPKPASNRRPSGAWRRPVRRPAP